MGVVAVWWLLFGVTGALVWLFAFHLERETRVSRGQTAALTGTLARLAEAPALDAFLNEVLVTLVRQLRGDRGALLLGAPPRLTLRLLVDPDRPVAEAAARSDRPVTLTLSAAALGERPVSSDDLAQVLPGLFPAEFGSGLLVALQPEGQPAGLLVIGTRTRRRLRSEELALAQALAQQATLALRLAELAAQGEQVALVDERNRLAREIHDTLAQGFAGIAIQLQAAEETLADEPAAAQAHLLPRATLARDSLQEARRSVQALRPQALVNRSLSDALRQMAQRLTAGSGCALQLELAPLADPLPQAVEDELLRIAQEAVHNAVKHAGAATIRIGLRADGAALVLTVADDGRGLPQEAGGGFGLIGMRERAARLGARLTIEPGVRGGTVVSCAVPDAPAPAGKEPS